MTARTHAGHRFGYNYQKIKASWEWAVSARRLGPCHAGDDSFMTCPFPPD
jgi:hypothetical protein